MKRLSKQFYMWSLFGGGALSILSMALFYYMDNVYGPTNPGPLFMLPLPLIAYPLQYVTTIYFIVVSCVFYYKMRAAIRDSHTRISPAATVVFLFIPIIGFFWAVYTIVSFPHEYNEFIERHSIKAKELPGWLFIVLVFSCLLFPVFLVIYTILVMKICDAINALPASLLKEVTVTS